MINPEISRRCLTCGVAVRDRAFFCPQCGRKLGPLSLEQSNPALSKVSEPDPATAEDGNSTLIEKAESPKVEPPPRLVEATKTGIRQPKEPRVLVPRETRNGHLPAERGASAAAAARGVIEDNLRPRVERLRKVSSVVIDEAAYDPSLRFVLVAALLFGMFLLLLLLNELIG